MTADAKRYPKLKIIMKILRLPQMESCMLLNLDTVGIRSKC